MITPAGQEEPPEDTIYVVDILGEFENWLLDLVVLDGVRTEVGTNSWHQCPIDLWVKSRKFNWEWADLHPLIREYRRLIDAIHPSTFTPIPAYEALAILSLLKTLIRYRLTNKNN